MLEGVQVVVLVWLGESSVDGVDCIRSLWFSKVVCKSAKEVASLLAEFVGANAFFHVESFDGVAAQVLNNFPELYSTSKDGMLKGSANM